MGKPLYLSGAAGYDQLFARITRSFMPALLAAADIAAGHRVLDVATGTGAAAEAAAEIVGPAGEVIAGDISRTMLNVARRHMQTSGVKFELLDGHALPYPKDRFDRVLCQMGLMFFEDPARGLSEFHRVLTAAGRAAVSVNSTPERSLFLRVATAIGRYVPSKADELNRYASIRTIERLGGLLRGAGFAAVEVHGESRSFTFASFDDYFSGIEAGAGLAGQEYVKLPEDIRRDVRQDVRRSFPGGAQDTPFTIEMEVLVGAGRK